MTRRARMTCAVVILICAWTSASVRAEDDPWADFRFLMGSWISEARPEEVSGSFTLEPDLGSKILVRRNIANLPAAKGRPAAKHEDLMIIYREPGGKSYQASYFDNEGHIIHYTVGALPGKKSLLFVSNPDASGARFRLTYTKGEQDNVSVKFEIAPPGSGEQFKTYLEGTVRRKSTSK